MVKLVSEDGCDVKEGEGSMKNVPLKKSIFENN